ncbi:MAG TPA: zinc-dependent metalloprotease family protein [Xanthomonadaceae bacterium]|nr:zinc-dependent metalloprotease family protein [Xanthomonadaceae bacterium]
MIARCLRSLLPMLVCATGQVAAAAPDWRPAEAGGKSLPSSLSSHYAALPAGSAHPMLRGSAKAQAPWTLHLPDGSRFRVELAGQTLHANGDVTYAGTVERAGALYPVMMTVGPEASFGTWRTPLGEYRFESRGAEGWLLEVHHRGLALEPADTHAVGSAGRTMAPSGSAAAKAGETVIDVLFVFSANFAARYPGSAAQTRVNHLVALANQALADSAVSLVLRLVGAEATAYPDSAGGNGPAVQALASTLAGQSDDFPGLRQRRSDLGADLVTLVWPHEIETRGSCGVAFFPDGRPELGVNVVSDGFDSWSLCADDVYAHEVGHNLGAEHQNGSNSGEAGFGTPFILPGRLHTVMGSFGSGHPDRYLGLSRFSNPDRRCGGVPCGVPDLHDNARRLRQNMAAVAAYAPQRSVAVVAAPPPHDPDVDGDGVPESQDAFPHDPRWHADRDGDGVADPVDAFPDDPSEWADTDGDGVGDNADPDDDGDGIADAQDAFPLDPSEHVDSDGDRVGDNADAFPLDRREWRDSDGDGIGDNAEPDADDDGVPDFATPATLADVDLLVISAGTDRVLRLDGASGLYGGVEIADAHVPQALGPQSAIDWNPHDKRLYALVGGGVRRYDRAGPTPEGILIHPTLLGPLPGLQSSFPSGLAVAADGTLVIADEHFRVLAMHDAITGELKAGGVPAWIPRFNGVLRDVAVSGERAWALERDGMITEADIAGARPLRSDRPVPTGFDNPWNAADIEVTPDGSALLIADPGSGTVLRVAVERLDHATIFIAAGSGGLDGPAGLAFGPDGHLYVSSIGSDQVLRYDGTTGAFIDVFSKTPPGVLEQPRDLRFVPKVRDRYPRDAQRRFRPVPGNWYNPARSGHGLELQRSGDRIGLLWYTYLDDGTPTWYLAPARPLVDDVWSAPLLRFTWDGVRATGVEVGSVSLRFADERHADFSWTLPGSSGQEPIQLLLAGTTSESQFPTAAWYPPAESGWGLSVGRQGEVAFAVAFVYDQAGEPTWVAGASAASPTRMVMPVSVFAGPDRCPGCTGPRNAEPSPAGELVFEILGEADAVVDADFTAPGLSWQRSGSAQVPLTDVPTRPNDDPLP